MTAGNDRSISPAPITKVRPTASRITGGTVERKVVYMIGLEEDVGRQIHEEREQEDEHDDDRQRFDALGERAGASAFIAFTAPAAGRSGIR